MRLAKLVLLTATAISLAASCNPDDNVDTAKAVAGTYTGYATASFMYSPTPMVSAGQTLTVTEEAAGTVSVSYTSDMWGTFSISDVKVTETDGVYTLDGNGKTVMGMSADTQSEYDCSLTAVVSGTDDFSFEFDVPAVMGGLKITLLPGNPPADLVVSGTYTGTLTMSVMGSAMDPLEDAAVTVVADGDKAVLTLPAMGMGSMTIGEISVEAELAEAADGGYALTASSIDTMAGELSVTGSLAGTVSADGSLLTVNAEITPGAMPMAISITYEGTK